MNVSNYKNVQNIEKNQNDMRIPIITKNNAERFVTVPSLQSIKNKNALVNLQTQKYPSLQAPPKIIVAPKNSILPGNLQKNQQSDGNYNSQKRLQHILKLPQSVITKPLIRKSTDFIPVLKPVDPKQFKNNSKTIKVTKNPKIKVNQIQPLQPIQNVAHNTWKSPNTNTQNAFGDICSTFYDMATKYPSDIMLIQHLLALEKCRQLGDVVRSNDPIIKSRNGFHWGFSRKVKLSSDNSDNNN